MQAPPYNGVIQLLTVLSYNPSGIIPPCRPHHTMVLFNYSLCYLITPVALFRHAGPTIQWCYSITHCVTPVALLVMLRNCYVITHLVTRLIYSTMWLVAICIYMSDQFPNSFFILNTLALFQYVHWVPCTNLALSTLNHNAQFGCMYRRSHPHMTSFNVSTLTFLVNAMWTSSPALHIQTMNPMVSYVSYASDALGVKSTFNV